MLHLELLRSPFAHARINSIDTSSAAALPGVVAVVTGELMAQHNLAWMPTLSGDTQAVLATDKVRFQGQEVAAVVAETRVHRQGRARADRRRLRAAPGRHEPSGGARGRRARHPRREGRPGGQLRLPLGGRRQGGDRPRLRRGRPHRHARDVLPALASGAARVLRLRRRRQPRDRQGDDLHDLPGASRASHAVRDRGRAAGAADPDRLAGHRRRLRQQGAHLSGLRRRHGGVAADRPAGQVDRGSHRQPDLDRLRPRLPHEGRARAQGRPDGRSAGDAPLRPGRVLRRCPAEQVPRRALPHRHGLLRHPGGARRRRRLLHEQGARRGRLPLLVPRHRGLVPDRAPRRRGGPGDRQATPPSYGWRTSSSPSSSRTSRRPASSTTRATTRER